LTIAADGQAPERSEQEQQFRDLLQELRVMLPGVQILLAFLLTVPFDARFEILSDVDRYVFGIAVLAGVVSVALLIAPTAQHRIAWWRGTPNYDRLLPVGSSEALAGLAATGVASVASGFVVFDLVFHQPLAAAAGAFIAASFVGLWLLLPLRMR
jgi:hypothetical protein